MPPRVEDACAQEYAAFFEEQPDEVLVRPEEPGARAARKFDELLELRRHMHGLLDLHRHLMIMHTSPLSNRCSLLDLVSTGLFRTRPTPLADAFEVEATTTRDPERGRRSKSRWLKWKDLEHRRVQERQHKKQPTRSAHSSGRPRQSGQRASRRY
eukprot:tig00000940_g5543.t1